MVGIIHLCIGDTTVGAARARVPDSLTRSVYPLDHGIPILLRDWLEEHFPEWESVRAGESGFFYGCGDSSDMAEKMEGALSSTARKERMREVCLAIIRDRYKAGQADAIISAVKKIISRKR
jgi:hypothetical protein